MYEAEIPPLFLLKGILPRFQNEEFASGVVATPKSPIAAARASGAIRKKGTAEVTTFISCALAGTEPMMKKLQRLILKYSVSYKRVYII